MNSSNTNAKIVPIIRVGNGGGMILDLPVDQFLDMINDIHGTDAKLILMEVEDD